MTIEGVYNSLEEKSNLQEERIIKSIQRQLEIRTKIRELQTFRRPNNLESVFASGKIEDRLLENVGWFVDFKQKGISISLKTEHNNFQRISSFQFNQTDNLITAIDNYFDVFGVDCNQQYPQIKFKFHSNDKLETALYFSQKACLLTSTLNSQLRLYSKERNYEKPEMRKTDAIITNLKQVNNNQFLSCDNSKQVTLWEFEKMLPVRKFSQSNERILGMHVDEALVYCWTDVASVLLFDVRNKAALQVLQNPANSLIKDVNTSENNNLVVGFENMEIWEFDKISWKPIEEATIKLPEYQKGIDSYQFSCGNFLTFVASDNHELHVFESVAGLRKVGRVQQVCHRDFFFGYNRTLNSITALTIDGELLTFGTI